MFLPRLVPVGVALVVPASAELSRFSLPISRVPARIPRLGQATDGGLEIVNDEQFVYSVPVIIDSQSLDLVIDTGSSDLWAVSNSCKDQDCLGVSSLSPSSSTVDTGIPFNLEYLTGSAHGQILRTTFSIGPYQVENQALAAVSRTADLGLSASQVSGILGLCFPGTAAIPATAGSTPLQNLMNAVNEPVFAFHLGRMSGSADPNASLTFGNLDPAFAPDPSKMAVSDVVRTGREYDYWKIPIQRFTINGSPIEISVSRVLYDNDDKNPTPIAVLDSGTTLILGPSADIAALYAALGVNNFRYDRTSGYQLRCTLAVIIGVVLGEPSREYIIHPSDFAWSEGADGPWCLGGIQPNDNVNSADFLLGDTFLRNVYVAHWYSDTPKIGLLGLTDPAAALAEFRQERGSDLDDDTSEDATADENDSWDTATGYVKRWEQHANSAAIRLFAAIAGGIGFVLGGVGAIGWRIWRRI